MGNRISRLKKRLRGVADMTSENDPSRLSDESSNLETKCLLALLQFSRTIDTDLDAIARKAVELVPGAWPDGTDIRVKVALRDSVWQSPGSMPDTQVLTADIEFDRHFFGTISIGCNCADESVRADFLQSRGPRILDAVATQIGQTAFRQMVHAELVESEFRHRIMTRHSPVGLIRTDAKGQILDCNHAAAALFGTTETQLRGLNCFDEVTESGLKDVIPGAIGGAQAEHEGAFVPMNGDAPIWLRIVASPLETPSGNTEVIATLEDITRRKRDEAALAASRASLAEAQRIAHVGSWEFDMATRRISGSDECKRIFEVDLSLPSINAADIVTFFRPDFREQMVNRLRASTEPDTPAKRYSQVALSFADGRQKWVDIVSEVERDDLGIPKRLFGIVHDITDEHQNEIELREARDQAEAAARARSDFMANISHEIRTPLNAIIGMTGLVLQTRLNDKQIDYLTKVENASKSLLGIVDDILDFSRIEGNGLRIADVEFSPEDVIADVIDVNELRASEKGLNLHTDIDMSLPARLRGDPLRVNQILNNLVGNAIKFTERGDIVIRAAVADAGSPASHPAMIRFEVSDTGIGMTGDQLSRLFHPFFQVDTSSTREFGGTGMGLAISRQLCRLMGGTISADSTPGLGSTFKVELPLSVVDGTTVGALERELMDSAAGVRVLVVDSSPIDRGIMVKRLSGMSFTVDSASEGAEAVALVDAAEKAGAPYHMIFIDMTLQAPDGLQTARLISHRSRTGAPMILTTTAYLFDDDMQTAAGRLFYGLLFKPVLPTSLTTCVRRVMTGAPQMPESAVRHSFKFDGASVLLVEDNRVNQQVALELLRKTGVSVTLAENGRDALRMVDSAPFDLVFMDIQMPVMDGLDATRMIRRLGQPWASTMPIIAMTAHGMGQHIQKSLDAGMNGHITKPVEPEALYATMAKWLRGSRTDVKTERTTRTDMSEPRFRHDLHVPGLNVGKGLGYVGGNIELYKKLLRKFVEEYEGKDSCLDSAEINNNPQEARRFVHSMKSLAGTLGAITLQEKAASLERAILDKDYFQHGLIDAFRAQLSQLFASLRALPELFGPEVQDIEETQVGRDMQHVDVPGVIMVLKAALRKLQPSRSQHFIAVLSNVAWPASITLELARARDAIMKYRFSEALCIIEQLEQAMIDLAGDMYR